MRTVSTVALVDCVRYLNTLQHVASVGCVRHLKTVSTAAFVNFMTCGLSHLRLGRRYHDT